MSRVRPSFFIVGTMKGGTTVLYDDICLHPRVDRASRKEIHYFSLNLHEGEDWYLDHFDAGPGQITGEASPTYFDAAYTASIPKCIAAFNPAGKVIVITRDPVERAVSHFYHLQRVNKSPDVVALDINEFFASEFRDCITVTDNRSYLLQQVLYFSSYARKAMFYRGVFGSDRILFLDNDALRTRPRETLEQVFAFLGLEPIHDDSFSEVKFTSGRTSADLTPEIKAKLSDFFAHDYRVYAKVSGMPGLPEAGA